MNQMWVRISLTYIVIVIFLFLIPSVVYLTIRADEINLGFSDWEKGYEQIPSEEGPNPYSRLLNYPRTDLVVGLLRVLLFLSAGSFCQSCWFWDYYSVHL